MAKLKTIAGTILTGINFITYCMDDKVPTSLTFTPEKSFSLSRQRMKDLEAEYIRRNIKRYYTNQGDGLGKQIVDVDKLFRLYLDVVDECADKIMCFANSAAFFYETRNVVELLRLQLRKEFMKGRQ
jgi:hypothetical protein